MIKKVLNWVFGSFFRSIGRIIAYLTIGGLIFYIGNKLNIFNFMQVNAAVYNGDWLESNNVNMISWGGMADCSSSSNCSSVGTTTSLVSERNKEIMIIHAMEQINTTSSGGGMAFYYNTNYLLNKDYLYNITTYVCSNKALSNLSVSLGTSTNSTSILNDAKGPVYQDTVRSAINPVIGSYCYAYQSLFVPRINSHWFRIRLHSASISNIQSYLVGYSIETLGIYSGAISNILQESNLATSEDLTSVTNEIKEEQQNTTNAVQDVNDTINNSDTSESQSTAGSFFSGFSDNDHGGLSGIITAPLGAINEMLSNQCSPLTASYKGKEMSLPCGSTFWNGLGEAKTFYNVIVGGLLCYRIILKLFVIINNLKNPENDKIEVMNL